MFYFCSLLKQERPNIALLFFSQSSRVEGQRKQWLPGRTGKNAAIASNLIEKSSRVAYGTRLPVFHYHEDNQRGHSFGEKIANAYEEIFRMGYEAVIAIGNDSPEIEGTDWHQVCDRLRSGQNVIGPTHRGGTYLIGIHASSFSKKAFTRLPWQTKNLLPALKLHLEGALLIDQLHEANTFNDLLQIIGLGSIPATFKSLLLIILREIRTMLFSFSKKLRELFLPGSGILRGPPALAPAFA